MTGPNALNLESSERNAIANGGFYDEIDLPVASYTLAGGQLAMSLVNSSTRQSLRWGASGATAGTTNIARRSTRIPSCVRWGGTAVPRRAKLVFEMDARFVGAAAATGIAPTLAFAYAVQNIDSNGLQTASAAEVAISAANMSCRDGVADLSVYGTDSDMTTLRTWYFDISAALTSAQLDALRPGTFLHLQLSISNTISAATYVDVFSTRLTYIRSQAPSSGYLRRLS